MDTQLTPQQRFEERIRDEVKGKIGDLIPPDVLQDFVKRAIHDAFFKERVETISDNWRTKEVKKEPWFIEFVKLEAKALIREEAQKWLAENPHLFDKALRDALGASADAMLMNSFCRLFEEPFRQMQQNMDRILNDLRNKGVL